MTDAVETGYDANYYASHLGIPYERSDHWLQFFGQVGDRIVATISPETALDVGCAYGFLVEALRDRSVDAQGTDLSEYAISQVGGSAVGHCRVRSALEPIEGRFDLISCIEVVEHLTPEDGREALRHMTNATDRLLLSSTPYDHAEPTHLNVQPVEYWAALLAELGFYRDVDYDASYLTSWAGLFVRRGEPTAAIVKDYERSNFRFREEAVELRRALQVAYNEASARSLADPQDGSIADQRNANIALQQELLIARDSVLGAEAQRGTAMAKLAEVERELAGLRADQAVWEELISNYERRDPNELAEELARVHQRLNDVETSSTWRLGWAVLAPYRWLRGQR